MNENKIQTLKGFRDYYPREMSFQKWLYSKMQKVSESFGFEEYNGPIVEPLELYAAKSGEELVKKQSYVIQTKDESTIVLRPEMTPTLAKMVAAKENELVFPVKWFTYGARFRYEKPQKGRGREFFQWDVDILGSESVIADAEVISIAAYLYKELGLTSNEVVIKVNDRELVQESLIKSGVPKNKLKNVIKIIDKKEKVSQKDFFLMLTEEGLDKKTAENIQEYLSDTKAFKKSEWLSKLFELLIGFGVDEYVVYDPTIVRGLDYYTRTVFEGWDVKGEFRSIWGGGRYDNLTSDVGSKKKIPGVGFAMGNMVLEEILKENKKYPTLDYKNCDVLVTIFSQSTQESAIKLSDKLRGVGARTEIYPGIVKLDKQLKYADKKAIDYVVILGENEMKNNKVILKNLKSGKQETMSEQTLIKFFSSSNH